MQTTSTNGGPPNKVHITDTNSKQIHAIFAKAITDRIIIDIFVPPAMLHSDQGRESAAQIVVELQRVFGYDNTRITPYPPKGNFMSERVHSTMHAMLAMHSSIKKYIWERLLPLVQPAHYTYRVRILAQQCVNHRSFQCLLKSLISRYSVFFTYEVPQAQKGLHKIPEKTYK